MAVLLRLEALGAAILAELRRKHTGAEVDMQEVIDGVWASFGPAVWCVAELVERDLVDPAQSVRIGQALGRLYRDGGRCGRLVLDRLDGIDRQGRRWRLEQL